MPETMIETHDLRRVFKTRRGDVEAVAGVDLRIEAGEIFGFLGPNGAGKTTTLRMLATLLPPSGGGATIAGCDLRRQPQQVRERIGYVGQAGGTDPQIAGDVVVIGVHGDQRAALELLKGQPFVRDAGSEDGTVRLYVDRGEVAMPAILRLLDSAGLELRTISLTRPSLDDVFLRQTGRSLREEAA